ncbi:kinase-like protein [Athelia psychrophila]|uniref:Kinase-like protein n=1 Tax=Athelia psychrophila TaxID=1759441 RepID=A0A166TPU6_9AGAM|nr:kinase-like protein [Fibularhizoctonia sp. CBS 109695]
MMPQYASANSSSPYNLVAVKHLRPCGTTVAHWQRMTLRLRREIIVWQRLRHENVVPLLGTISNNHPCIGLISPWMEAGNLNTFLHKESLTLAYRVKLSCDIAAGLCYLHHEGIVHGDLTGANVLIDDNDAARLVDFGLSTIMEEFQGTSFMTSTVGGAMRYRAPELLPSTEADVHDVFKPTLTTMCDVYSLGSVVLQILSGHAPYYNIQDDILVTLALSRRVRPSRPPSNSLTDPYWDLITRCWVKASFRPSADEVYTSLLQLYESSS